METIYERSDGTMKKLGFGLMRLPLLDPNNDAAIDIEQLKTMVDIFMSKGFTYFDTAIMYNGFASQRAIKDALVDRYPRESYTLATKLHNSFFDTLEGRDRIFEEQLQQTGAGYFDYYLIHGIDAESYKKYTELDCFNWVLDKKAKGLVKHAGFSFHDSADLLDRILTEHPEMEFVQLQINYLDWESEWIQSRAIYEVACKHQKPVVVMEPVKGGTLAAVPELAEKIMKAANPDMSVSSWAIRFAASLDNVMVVLSGMSNIAQMEDNVSYMENFIPLTDDEIALTRQITDIINGQIAVPCTGCSYCTEGCPVSIPIPKYFSLYNEDMREDLEEKGWTVNFSNYKALTKTFGKASDCVACGQCEAVCPQHLPIVELMRKVTEHFES